MDLSKLEYGSDYYALPPYTICWMNDNAREFCLDDMNTLKQEENGDVYQIEILEQNRFGFTYKLKNK